MSQNSLSPHDPKFTAYALGELDPAECAAVEAALRDNPAARATVEEIRAVAAQLSAALAAEPSVETTTVAQPMRAAIMADRDHRKPEGGPAPYAKKKLIKFPEFYYISGLAAAACFAVFVSLQEPKPHPRRQISPAPGAEGKVYTVLDLVDDANATPSPSITNAENAEAGMAVFVAPGVSPLRPELPPADVRVADAKRETLAQSAPAETSARAPAETLAFGTDAGQRPATVTTSVPTQAARSASPLVSPAAGPVSSALAESTLLTSSAQADVTLVSAPDTAQVAGGASGGNSRIAGNGPQLSFSAPRSEQPARAGGAPGTPGGAPLPLFNAGGVALSGYEVSGGKDGNSVMRGIPAAPVAGSASGATNTKQPMQLTPLVASTQSEGAAVSIAMKDATQNSLPGESLGMPSDAMSGRLPWRSGVQRGPGTSEGDFLAAKQNRISTFPLDVDPMGYLDVRRMIEGGRLPPAEAVHIEEMVNYFPFSYRSPDSDHPVAASIEVASAPWAPAHRLVRIGLKAQEIPAKPRAAANLVFLVDVSASMAEPNKLSLVKESIRSLVGKMRPDDQVAIVTYAGRSGLALPSTPVANAREILDALDALQPRESPGGAMGIQLAYDIARANFVTGGPNRVILCTDGDLNIGISDERELDRLVSDRAKSGVLLSVFGLGTGSLKDAVFANVANRGGGDHGFVKTRREAGKLLLAQVEGPPTKVAKEVKLEVDFNPINVASYRLIGSETPALQRRESSSDPIDQNEVEAGDTITALYEVVPVAAESRSRGELSKADGGTELLTLKISYKRPGGFFSRSRKLEVPVVDRGASFANATRDFRFAAAVASFGMILRQSPHRGSATMSDILEWAAITGNEDSASRRPDFVQLVNAARRLMP